MVDARQDSGPDRASTSVPPSFLAVLPSVQGGDRHKACHRIAATGKEGYGEHGMRDGRWKQIDNEFLLNLSDEERQKAIYYLKKYMMLFRNG